MPPCRGDCGHGARRVTLQACPAPSSLVLSPYPTSLPGGDLLSATLPSTLSEKALAAALDGFAAAVGSDSVLTSEDELREFRDPFAFATWDEYTASAVVMPRTVEEIQEIVRIANEHKIPLWTHSTGRNNGYGGPAPRVTGSVIVSLRQMNRVLEINEECAYAVVEPGVRWFDLYDAIQAGGHKLMLSIADLGWGSVVGNTLDHGVTYMPHGQDMAAQCGMEVVLPNGEVMRTGMGAMPGNKAWHVYKRGLGPTPDQLFMQSNFGIVTKMGVWLMPYPECYMPFWIRVWKDADLEQVVDTMRQLMLDRTIQNVPSIYNTLAIASVLSPAGPVVRRRRADARRGDRPRRTGARARPVDHARRPVRRRGRARSPVRQDQGGVRAHPRRRGVGREVRAGGHPAARAPGRPDPGRRAEPRLEHDDRLVRRRGGRPYRLFACRTADRPRRRRAARPAARARGAAGGARLHRRPARRQRAQLHPHHDGHLRHEGRGAGARAPTTPRSCSSRRRPRRGTASTARTSTSWTSPPTSTASTTTPTGASTRRSRTRSTRTASSLPASRASGRRRCGRAGPAARCESRRGRGRPQPRRRREAGAGTGYGPGAADVLFCGICGSDLHFRDVPALFPTGHRAGPRGGRSHRRGRRRRHGLEHGRPRLCASVRAVRALRILPRGQRAGLPGGDRQWRRARHGAAWRLCGADARRRVDAVCAPRRGRRSRRHVRGAARGRGTGGREGGAHPGRARRGARRRTDRAADGSRASRAGRPSASSSSPATSRVRSGRRHSAFRRRLSTRSSETASTSGSAARRHACSNVRGPLRQPGSPSTSSARSGASFSSASRSIPSISPPRRSCSRRRRSAERLPIAGPISPRRSRFLPPGACQDELITASAGLDAPRPCSSSHSTREYARKGPSSAVSSVAPGAGRRGPASGRPEEAQTARRGCCIMRIVVPPVSERMSRSETRAAISISPLPRSSSRKRAGRHRP